ncbi:hypothetical protein J7I98_38515 [Streptomyces sp. ISL-98]|uniref:hypothetical protein n=1 Tax=Streptomyces sp. ISL-98 TaxID=2819192 RepID=UPI001BE5914C|nr:hypothetical protein [Streptomyces sp. ISL-98]MBT2511578.1 hypothetical protein [Streptomyces sp. ISL-98]
MSRATRSGPGCTRGTGTRSRPGRLRFPTAYATAQTLGWSGRQHRVLGDIHLPHGDTDGAAAYAASRDEAEQHGAAGERANQPGPARSRTRLHQPAVADDEIHLAEQLLTGLDLRATGFTTQIAALVRDAGITAAKPTSNSPSSSTTPCKAAERDEVRTVIQRLRQLAPTGGYACFVEITTSWPASPYPIRPLRPGSTDRTRSALAGTSS